MQPLRQYLVMSLMYGDSHHLTVGLFGPEVVSRVVHGVTGECPEKILNSSNTDILLVFGPEADVNRVKVQLECQSSWMGKPIHPKCTRPSGTELKQFWCFGDYSISCKSKRLSSEEGG